MSCSRLFVVCCMSDGLVESMKEQRLVDGADSSKLRRKHHYCRGQLSVVVVVRVVRVVICSHAYRDVYCGHTCLAGILL